MLQRKSGIEQGQGGFGDDVEFQHTRALGQQIPDADGNYQFWNPL